jgi:hypothetical protein
MELKYTLDNNPDLQDAHNSNDVHNIVDLLIRETNPIYFRAVLNFLRSNDTWGTERYVRELKRLRWFVQSNRTSDAAFRTPPNIDELIRTIDTMYNQSEGKLGYRRGAIVELLATTLVRCRRSESECRSNHCFVYDDGTKSPEIDVAVLSESTQQIEGYSCKINPMKFKQDHRDQLLNLAEYGQSSGFTTHIGWVSFGMTKLQLDNLQCSSITAYGIENFKDLRNDPFKPN